MDKVGFTRSRIDGDVMDVVLGLDMSSKKSGYALFIGGQLAEYGLWETDKTDWRERIAYMASCVRQYCITHNVKKIYAEDVPPTIDNSQTVKVLSALQGMLIALSVSHDIDITFIPVKTWKQKIGVNLTSSKANNQCKAKIKEYFGKGYNKPLSTVKGWVKGWEKKMSVDYVNHTFGIDLVYKSPSSKFNQDDIADSINIAWSQIGDVKPYDIETFDDIMDRFYQLIIQ